VTLINFLSPNVTGTSRQLECAAHLHLHSSRLPQLALLIPDGVLQSFFLFVSRY
jgi:hypothetical protein